MKGQECLFSACGFYGFAAGAAFPAFQTRALISLAHGAGDVCANRQGLAVSSKHPGGHDIKHVVSLNFNLVLTTIAAIPFCCRL